ncbi:GD25904 [Drosophila simulans]|uniref:GD25904 n=1 Tax=Drosophila simulans TaxID=7240 RepID=B4QBK8_DROSI|nr:GD25904 [Drosophila simulans]
MCPMGSHKIMLSIHSSAIPRHTHTHIHIRSHTPIRIRCRTNCICEIARLHRSPVPPSNCSSDVDEWPCRDGGAGALRYSFSILTVIVAFIMARSLD